MNTEEKTVERVLAHFGVKGQKWGVRRDDKTGVRPIAQRLNDSAFGRASQKNLDRHDRKVAEKKDKKEKKKFIKNQLNGKNMVDIVNTAAARGGAEISRINNKAAYKNADFSKPSMKRAKYYEEHRAAQEKVLNQVAKERGNTSESGRYKLEIQSASIGDFPTFSIIDMTVAHAETSDDVLMIKVQYNKLGHILKFVGISEELAQFNTDVEDFLEHFGVKGQKWGVRKDGASRTSAKSTPTARAKAKRMSDEDLQKAIKRMELEKRYVDLNKQTSNAGKQYAKGVLDQAGKGAATMVVSTILAATIGAAIKKRVEGGSSAKPAFKNLRENVSFT